MTNQPQQDSAAHLGDLAGGPSQIFFDRDEWELIVTLPRRVLMAAVAAAPAEGRRAAEGIAGIEAIASGLASRSPLVREVVASIYSESYQEPDGLIGNVDGDQMTVQTLAACRYATEVVAGRCGATDATAYSRLAAPHRRRRHRRRPGRERSGPAGPARPGREPVPLRARWRAAALGCASCGRVRTRRAGVEVGVGPWPGAVARRTRIYDPALLAEGDRRNVVDRYRYWRHEAIVADLDARRHDFHVAIENWQHDLNIGTVVRTANAFLAARGAHRRPATVEPARRHGDRPLPARALPPRPRGAGRLGGRRGPGGRRGGQPARARYPSRRCTCRAAACCSSARRGPGLSASGPGGGRAGLLDRPVRVDPLHQRRRGQWDRDAHVDPPARRTAAAGHQREITARVGAQ